MVVPKTYEKYTSRKVLTTGWVDGEKLSQSTESDVGDLVNVGVICYLKQVICQINRLESLNLMEKLKQVLLAGIFFFFGWG